MTAAVLREAAALMRKRAEAARAGRWVATGDVVSAIWSDGPRYVTTCDSMGGTLNAQHIASWHPDVTLKVAKSLEQAAAILDEADSGPLAMAMNAIAEPLVDVARAYLATP